MGILLKAKGMPAYFTQNEPDQPVAIELNIETIDKIGQEVMSGFGKVPKRGAEVGGILLGAVQPGDKPTVRIDDFIPVPIEYRFGPSWLLSETDEKAFAEAIANGSSAGARPVGFMRSNTRPEMAVSAEDIALIERYFHERPLVALLIRPFATRPSRAVFFGCAEGPFSANLEPGPEFSFRRKDLADSLTEMEGTAAMVHAPTGHESTAAAIAAPHQAAIAEPAVALVEAPPAAAVEARNNWTWLPLSFIFLLIGVLLGFQAALAFHTSPPQPDPYNLKLAVTKAENALAVKWDHGAGAVRTAQLGKLSIDDGPQHRTVDLGPAELTSGSVVYAPTTRNVRFRLDVFPTRNSIVSQTVDWQQ